MKKNLYYLLLVPVLLFGTMSSCSSDDKKTLTDEIKGTWNIDEVEAIVKSNNPKVTEAIKNGIEKFPYLGFLKVADLNFDGKDQLEVIFDMTQGQDPTWAPVVAKGNYKGSGDNLSIKSFSSIDLGGIVELLPEFMPNLDPALLANLPALVNTFLPFDLKINAVTGSTSTQSRYMTGSVNLTDIYKDPVKIQEILTEANITGVEAKDIKIEGVTVKVKCKGK